MLKHRIRRSAVAFKTQVSGLITLLLKDEAISGKFLLAAAIVALAIVNSPWREAYDAFWMRHFSITFGSHGISESLKHWINEGLMAIFFLVISLEIKREIVWGELRRWRVAALPIMAAIGGALAPIAIYLAINNGHGGHGGWGIPMTTDTAFSVGLLALLGNRVPLTLKMFLLTATVVDDVAAITAIAAFYNDGIHLVPLLCSIALLGTILLLHWLRLLRLTTFVVLGILMWVAVHESGIPSSITGVVLGLAAPLMTRRRTKSAVAARLERNLIPVSTFVIVPLFALANAGVSFTGNAFGTRDAALTGLGIAAGLMAGKVLGIVGGAWIVVRTRLGSLPEGVRWGHVTGVGLLSGVGFTLSIFIAELAFWDQPELIQAAKISIFGASLASAVLGLAFIRYYTRNVPPTSEVIPAVNEQA